MMTIGIYIGDEKQFKGRMADLVVYEQHVMAQFDYGKLWETHSRMCFEKSDWLIADELGEFSVEEVMTMTEPEGWSGIKFEIRDEDKSPVFQQLVDKYFHGPSRNHDE